MDTPGGNDQGTLQRAFEALSLHSSNTNQAANAVTTLANASKQDVAIRKKLADPHTLRMLIEIVECSIQDSVETLDVALRCIGNACADNNDARASITEIGFSWTLQCLAFDDNDINSLTTKVLYNICFDYEPAQQKCFREKVHYELISFCSSTFGVSDMNHSFAVDDLLMIAGQKAEVEPTLSSPMATSKLTQILCLPHLYFEQPTSVDTFASLIETALIFIRDASVQAEIVQNRLLSEIWQIMLDLTDQIYDTDPGDDEDVEDLKILVPLSKSLTWCLSDIAANSEFAKIYSLDDEAVERLIAHVMAFKFADRQNFHPGGLDQSYQILLGAACQVVGNLLWSLPIDKFTYLVKERRLDDVLFTLIVRSTSGDSDPDLLHSAAGLLIQLTRPSPEVRALMGGSEYAQHALERLCQHEMTQIKQVGVKLIKALGNDCPANQERFAELAKESILSMQDPSDVSMAEAVTD